MPKLNKHIQPFFLSLGFFLLYFAVMVAVGTFVYPIIGQINLQEITPDAAKALFSNPLMMLLTTVCSLIAVSVAVKVFLSIPSSPDYVDIGLINVKVIKDLLIGTAIGVVIIGLAFLVLFLGGFIKNISINKDFTSVYWGITLLTFLIIAYVEEIMCRGYIMAVFRKAYHPLAAILLSSVLFSLMHLGNPGFSWIGFFNIFLAGLLLGASFFVSRSVWMPIGIHLGWNFMQGTVLGFNVSGTQSETFLQLKLTGNSLINGGQFGLEGSLVISVLCLAALSAFWFSGKLSFEKIEFEDYELDKTR